MLIRALTLQATLSRNRALQGDPGGCHARYGDLVPCFGRVFRNEATVGPAPGRDPVPDPGRNGGFRATGGATAGDGRAGSATAPLPGHAVAARGRNTQRRSPSNLYGISPKGCNFELTKVSSLKLTLTVVAKVPAKKPLRRLTAIVGDAAEGGPGSFAFGDQARYAVLALRVAIPIASALRAVIPRPPHRWSAGSGSRAARCRTARPKGTPPARPRSSASRCPALR